MIVRTIVVSNEQTGEEFVSLDSIKSRYIEAVWRANNKNTSRAAKILRIDRKTLYRLLWRAGLFAGKPSSYLP